MPQRLEFEKKNLGEAGAKSFKLVDQNADIAFEFSSEGEFQRIKFLLDDLLRNKDFKCELIFCSPSVEKVVLNYFKIFPKQIRYYRLTTLLRGKGHLTHWISAKKLVVVQYDFFPQLLNLKKSMEKMVLVSPKLTNQGIYQSWCLKFFDFFLLDQYVENDFFNQENCLVGNLRELSVLHRKFKARSTIIQKLPWFEEFEKKILVNSERKIIFGNYWHDEYSFIERGDFPSVDDVLVIVPHEIDLLQNEKIIEDYNSISEVSEDISPDYAKNIFLFSVKGVLCELYQYFDIAYVGGGFKRNVHSLLEPFVAGCYCVTGPNVNRSNEYKMIIDKEPNRIQTFSKINLDQVFESSEVKNFSLSKVTQKINPTEILWYKKLKVFLSST